MTESIFAFSCGGMEISVSCDDDWHINETGIYRMIEPEKKSFVCSPIWVDSRIVDANTGCVKICIKGLNTVSNKVFGLTTEMANLCTGMQNPLPKLLANHGVRISQGENSRVLDYLARQPAPTVNGFDKLGWHQDEGKQLFVLPEQVIGGLEDKQYCFTPESYAPSQNALTGSGTLDSWQQFVVSECMGNPVPLFALGVAFAAPLMCLFHVDGGGFHFWGHSSRGKTTILQIGASVFGNAADPALMPECSFIQRWNTTANALEGTALAYNDLLLPMDELGTSNIKNFGQVVYQLAGGKGKAAMNASRDMRTPRTWRTQIMSTGEHAIAQEIETTTGSEARTGQMIRMVDICVEGNIFPAFPVEQVADKVTILKVACSEHYGVAAVPYLHHLVRVVNSSLKNDWVQRFEYIEDALANSFPNLQPEQQRAIKRFALVACGLMMATEARCISVKDEVIMDATVHVLGLWLKEFPTVSEADRGIEHLRQSILSNPSRFGSATDKRAVGNNLLGYKDYSKKRYIILRDKMSEVCGRSGYKPVLKKLSELGYLNHNAGRMDLKWRGATVYAVHFALFDDVVSTTE